MRDLVEQLTFLWESWERKTKESGARRGCMVYHADTQSKIGWDEHKWFLPASNNKLWTMAVALDRLGPNYCFETRFDVVGSKVFVQGGGDPVFSFQDAVHVAQKMKERGLNRIEALLLDDHRFECIPWGEGWMWDDLSIGYGAPVHAINMEGNRITFKANPRERVPRFTWSPSLPTIHVEEEMTWTEERESDLQIKRGVKNNHFLITGRLSRHDPEEAGAVWSGPHFFAEVFLQACCQVGIEVAPEIQIEEGLCPAEATLPLRFFSPPLREILGKVGADSDNMVAEVLLKTIAMEANKVGTAVEGRKQVISCLHAWDVEPPATYVDGSGLSMYNLSSPRQYVQLLQFIANRPKLRPVFLNSLSVYGERGTLQDREEVLKPGVKVLAKTGSLSGVSNLSGYLMVDGKIRFIFSLLIQGLLDERNGEKLQNDFIRILSFVEFN